MSQEYRRKDHTTDQSSINQKTILNELIAKPESIFLHHHYPFLYPTQLILLSTTRSTLHSNYIILPIHYNLDQSISWLLENVQYLEFAVRVFPDKSITSLMKQWTLERELIQLLVYSTISLKIMDWVKHMYIFMQTTVWDKTKTTQLYK